MLKKITTMLLLVICFSTLVAQQKMTANDIIGKWQVTALAIDDKSISVESDESLWSFMTGKTMERKKANGDSTALNADDSSGIEMSVKMLGNFRNSDITFMANKTYKFSFAFGGEKKIGNGTWFFNPTTQTIRIKEIKKGMPKKSNIEKIIVKGTQLLMQMEKDKEEGFLFTKTK